MPNIDNIIKALRSLLEFIGNHPYLSMPIVAIILVITATSLVKSFREQLGWAVRIIASGTKRERAIVFGLTAVVSLVAIILPVMRLAFEYATM